MHAMSQSNFHGSQIGAASGYMSADVNAIRDMSPLEQAMDGNTNGIHELASCLVLLEGRLQCLLRPVPPQTESGKQLQGVDVAHSTAVDQMHAQRRQIENLIRRVHDIAGRLET